MLQKLVPTPELATVVAKLFRKRWDEDQAKTAEMRLAANPKAAAIEKKIGVILDRIMESESKTVITRYESEVEKLERKKISMIDKTAKCGTSTKSYDDTFRTAFWFLSNPWNIWKNGTFEDKQIVLRLTLASHIQYDWNDGVRTANLSLPFRLLEDVCGREKQLTEAVPVISCAYHTINIEFIRETVR